MSEFPATSLRALATNIIDYAGIFPPAKLPLTEAFPLYLKYSTESYNWMLSKFIIPAALLPELTELVEENNITTGQIPLSIILKGGNSVSDFSDSLNSDLKELSKFNERYNDRFLTDTFEVKLPEDALSDGSNDSGYGLMNTISGIIRDSVKYDVRIYFEASPGENWTGRIDSFTDVLRKYNDNNPPAGYKLRTGGESAAAHPHSIIVARILKTCSDKGLPLKFTAGLHHPFRHFNEKMGSYIHGFINLFGAGVLLSYHPAMDEETVLAIINEEDHSKFKFKDEEFSWSGYSIPTGKITLARKKFVISYGSCSFDEPVEDLQKLNLL